MAARIRFDSQPNGVRFFSDEERDDEYLKAAPFLLEQMRVLLEDGWKPNKNCNSEEVYPFLPTFKDSTHYLTIILISSYSTSPSH